jgi:hypothetical protein
VDIFNPLWTLFFEPPHSSQMDALCPDSSYLVLDNLDDTIDFLNLCYVSKYSHLMVDEYRRRLCLARNHRRAKATTLVYPWGAPQPEALRRLFIVESVTIAYEVGDIVPTGEMSYALPMACHPTLIKLVSVQCTGYTWKESNLISYDHLPEASRLPGFPTVATLTEKMENLAEKITGHKMLMINSSGLFVPRTTLTITLDETVENTSDPMYRTHGRDIIVQNRAGVYSGLLGSNSLYHWLNHQPGTGGGGGSGEEIVVETIDFNTTNGLSISSHTLGTEILSVYSATGEAKFSITTGCVFTASMVTPYPLED